MGFEWKISQGGRMGGRWVGVGCVFEMRGLKGRREESGRVKVE